MKDITIIGGGLSGLISSILLAKEGFDIHLVEAGNYPSHKVCGEYISNEVKPFLQSIDCFPNQFNPPHINQFLLTSTNGKKAQLSLEMGGFGISRFSLDHFLYEKAKSLGVIFTLNKKVEDIYYHGNYFEVVLPKGETIKSELVLGCYGKRSKLDFELNRKHLKTKAPWVGIKYHFRTKDNQPIDIAPKNQVALHNFPMGYFGFSQIENNQYNGCYLVNRDALKQAGSIDKLEEQFLFQNPYIKRIYENTIQLFEKPLVINEVNFNSKETIINHIPMAGDAAGLITPLCGNGMAMAIHGGKILAEQSIAFFEHRKRKKFEMDYQKQWTKTFATRLSAGKKIQNLFGNGTGSNFAVGLVNTLPFIGQQIVKLTHGKTIPPYHPSIIHHT